MELTIRKSEGMDDWYVIERAEHDGRIWIADGALQCASRFSDADVEGTAAEMLAIADGIERRTETSFKRCAVSFQTDGVHFDSPRNSQRDGVCSLEEADALAAKIRTALGGKDAT